MNYRVILMLLVSAWTSAADCAAAEGGPAPFRLMRSLQLVQDRIAAGDRDAIPLQDDMMPLIEEAFRAAGSAIAQDPRDLDALMMYALSGGDVRLVKELIPFLKSREREAKLATAVVLQRSGQAELAARVINTMRPQDFSETVGAYLAIFKSGLATPGEEPRVIAELDMARIAAPGTLVEEAALRRQLSLSAGRDDFGGVMRTARRYFDRFAASPFAGPLVDAFSEETVRLSRDEDRDAVEALVDHLSPQRALAVFYRLARAAAVQGRSGFLAWASEIYGERLGEDASPKEQANLAFFRALARLPALDRDEALARFRAFDGKALGADEKRLLLATRSVLAAASVSSGSDKNASEAKVIHSEGKSREADPAEVHTPQDDPAQRNQEQRATTPTAAKSPAASEPETTATPDGKPTGAGGGGDEFATFVGDMRARLDALDKQGGEQ
jgi:chemotaxis protein MotC